MNKKEEIKTAKMIVMISGIVKKAKQRTIKRIIKRLEKKSANELSYLEKLLS